MLNAKYHCRSEQENLDWSVCNNWVVLQVFILIHTLQYIHTRSPNIQIQATQMADHHHK